MIYKVTHSHLLGLPPNYDKYKLFFDTNAKVIMFELCFNEHQRYKNWIGIHHDNIKEELKEVADLDVFS